MPQPETKSFTSEDYLSLPEGEHAELIHGQFYAMAPPNPFHQELVMELSAAILKYIKEQGGKCKVYPAPLAVNLHVDDTTWLEPDISIICDKNKITDRGCHGAPDWIIEIVSSSSSEMDYFTKNALYKDAHVREYWIVDPLKERTTVYRYEEDDVPTMLAFNQDIKAGLHPDSIINISKLLRNLS